MILTFPKDLTPPRFRTAEDAKLYMECFQMSNPFPAEKWIHPYILMGDASVQNPEYRDAPYEVGFLTMHERLSQD